MATVMEATPPARKADEVLEELISLLEGVASGRMLDRSLAVRYTELRPAALGGELRNRLPPFLLQCVSLYKFQDFIGLYAPDAERRLAFVRQAFADCRNAPPAGRTFDVFE
jgi:hypothetical protein